MPERLTRRELLRRCGALVGGLALLDRADDGRAATSGHGDARTAAAGDRPQACVQGGRVRWIVGWSPGGGFDTYSRLAEPFIEEALGAQIAIDNIPGAGGRLAALTLSRARPDGRTLGILNGSGFLWNRQPDSSAQPDLLRDFTVLARVAGRQQVIVAAGMGPRSVEELVALSRRRPLVAGVTSADSSSFASLAAVTHLLGAPTEYIAGYPGSSEVMLGLERGDFDFTSLDLESFIQAPMREKAVPLLQITPERSPDPRLRGIPHLAGPMGLISVAPELFPGDPARARSLAAGVAAYLEFGRLVAGPGGMAPALRECLDEALLRALRDPRFEAAARRAGRSIDVLSGAAVRRSIPAVMEAVRPIAPVAAAAARRIR